MGSSMAASRGSASMEPRKVRSSRTVRAARSTMLRSRQVTASASGRRRAPWQAVQVALRTKRRMESLRLPRRISSMTGTRPR